jgi:aldehyde dehydrogenase (NAD+)
MSHAILQALGLGESHSGTWLGHGEWSKTTDAGTIESLNPATNEVLAKVHASSAQDYETIVHRAQAAFETWRNTPAPRRGEAVRLCAEALPERAFHHTSSTVRTQS